MHPHKSTTHKERFFHFTDLPGPFFAKTVFVREEPEGWFAAVAKCVQADKNHFNRKRGRTLSRRRYFQERNKVLFLGLQEPSYEDVVKEVLSVVYGV
jgi:hypothetical protein